MCYAWKSPLTALEYHLLFGAVGGLAAGFALWKGAKKRDK